MGRKKAFENRAQVIVEAADRLFSAYGFERTTVEDIAREVGISKASLYQEFSTKDDILESVIAGFLNKESDRLESIASQEHEVLLPVIKQMLFEHGMLVFESANTHHKANADRGVVAVANMEKRPKPSLIMINAMRKPPLILAGMLKKAAERGEILVQEDYEHAANLIFFSLVRFCAPPLLPFMKRESLGPLTLDLLDLLLNSLRITRK